MTQRPKKKRLMVRRTKKSYSMPIGQLYLFQQFFIYFFLNIITAKLYLQGQGIQASFTEQRIYIPIGMKQFPK